MSVVAAAGFSASGIHAGFKPSPALDLALVTSPDRSVVAAAVFTQNKLSAAPVKVSQAHLAASGHRSRAVILNSGNANAATGQAGLDAAEAICVAVAEQLGCDADEVLICSTGLIGLDYDPAPALNAMPAAFEALSATDGGLAAEAIMTTDTLRKESVRRAGGFVVGGMAKGAAMLEPNMATMLAIVTTDAQLDHASLQEALAEAVSGSFNAISTDGCTSTNDTVILLSSGLSGPPADPLEFQAALNEVCGDLALAMVDDAEGATKSVRLVVSGAASDAEAERAARQIANANLVKCSWYGSKPYWGRIASELGTSGIDMDPALVEISYGGHIVSVGCENVDHDEAAVASHMEHRHLEIHVDLGLGTGRFQIMTNDLTHAYVDENMADS